MSKPLILHELTGSPNNVKVRIALDVKGLDYERVPLDFDQYPGDRSDIVSLSTQPLLPCLKHGETIVFDSRSILRYLDANFPDTHRLYSSDMGEMRTIEEWELYSSTAIGPAVGTVFGQIASGSPDPEVCVQASRQLNDITAKMEEALESNDFLMGDSIKAPDVVCATGVFLGAMPDAASAASPIHAAFIKLLHLGEGRDRTRAWLRRVIEHDPISREWF